MSTPADNIEKTAPPDVRLVEITREPVELYKILKFEGMVSSGGEGKMVVAAGQVTVNGKVEIQKRKKIVAGDSIEFNGEKISIALAGPEPLAAQQVIDETNSKPLTQDGEKNDSK